MIHVARIKDVRRWERRMMPTDCGGLLRAIGLLGSMLVFAPVAVGDDWNTAAVLRGAHSQIGLTLRYDSGYQQIGYPGGDVPIEQGVCTDVVVRALRSSGLDLQRLVHEDMRANFAAYPANWGMKKPDWNIDHRRVPNLETYFRRSGMEIEISTNASDYVPGDIVSWNIAPNLPHIGLIADAVSDDGSGRPLVIHNIGNGTQIEDVLFRFPQRAHFRWAEAVVKRPGSEQR